MCRCEGVGLADNGKGNRFDPCRGWILFLPGSKQRLEAKIHFAEGVQARVNACAMWQTVSSTVHAHTGLSQGTMQPVQYWCAKRSSRQDGHRVTVDIVQIGADAVVVAKSVPDACGGSSGGDAMRRVAGPERSRYSAPITAECISGSNWSNVQEALCG